MIRSTPKILAAGFLVAAAMHSLAIRKGVWLLGAVLSALSLFGTAAAAMSLEGSAAGGAVVSTLVV